MMPARHTLGAGPLSGAPGSRGPSGGREEPEGARRPLMWVVGATLSALVLWLPALYLRRWEGLALPPSLVAWSALPALALLVAVARPRPAWTLGLFPVSHLPALVVAPALVGPRVFGGPQGGLATLAVGAVAWTWLELAGRAAVPADERRAARAAGRDAEAASLPGGRWAWVSRRVAGVFGLGVLLAFWVPALLGSRAAPRAGVFSVLVGAVVLWYGVAELSGRRLDRVLQRRRAARGAVGELFLETAPRPRALTWALVAAGLAGALVALWMGL